MTTVVLAVTHDGAPFLGLIDADAGFDGEGFEGQFFCLLFREKEVLLGGKDEVSVGVEFRGFDSFPRRFEVLPLEFIFAEGPVEKGAGVRDRDAGKREKKGFHGKSERGTS